MSRRSPRPSRLTAAVTALALAVTGVCVAQVASAPVAKAAPPASLNPFSASGGFTVYARQDALLRNQETEGSIAVGGTATVQGSSGTYSIIHVAAGTADYDLPTVDGDPTRFLVGEYGTDSTGILAITSAGTSDPALFGDLKLVDRDSPFQPFARADWTRLNTNPSNVDQTPLIDATHQSYPDSTAFPTGGVGNGSIYTASTSATAVADYVEQAADATWADAQACMADLPTTGYAVGVAEDAGDRVVLDPLSADQVNVVQYADIAAASTIQFSAGPTPGVANPLVIVVPAGTTSVSGATFDPQGQYSPYVLWDLSAVTGTVSVTAPNGGGTRMDGSIYAPEADLTVTASPLDGQVIGNNVTIGGGEVHSYLFAGQIACEAQAEGTFEVHKELSGIDESDLPAGTTFTVNYTATEPDGTIVDDSLDLPADGSTVDAGVDFPVGTTVTFAEIDPATVPGWTWGTPTITPGTITIGDGTSVAVTVTNTATELLGTVSVQKAVVDGDGDPVTGATGTITADWAASDGQSGSVSFPASGDVVTLPAEFPVGTTVTFSNEDFSGATVPAGYDWTGAGWSPSDTVTVDGTGTAAITLTNVVTPAGTNRTIAVQKVADGVLEQGYDYSITYSTDVDPTPIDQPIDIGVPTALDVDDAAAELTIAENPPTLGGTPVDTSAWEQPVITVDANGVETAYPVDFGDPVTIALPASGTISIAVENSLAPVPTGTFELQKAFALASARDASSVRATLGFTVSWTAITPARDAYAGVLRLPANGTPVSPLDASGDPVQLPYGTVVSYRELTQPSIPGVVWDEPEYSPAQLTIGVDDQATVSATITNTLSLQQGTFQVRKALEGIDPSQLLVDDIEISYTGVVPGQGTVSGSFTIPTDGTAAGPVDADGNPLTFPVGSVFQLAETTTPDEALPAGFQWTGTTWSPSSFIVIRPSVATPEVTVTNSVQHQTRYSVVKTVAGDAADLVPAGTTVPLDWWLDYDEQPQLGLVPNQVITSDYFPVGSIIEAREATPPAVDGVVWGTPTYYADGVELVPEADGRVVIPAASVDSQGLVELTLQNDAGVAPTPATASFSVTKSVGGGAASAVDADTEFTVEYTVDGGDVQTLQVTDGETVTVDGIDPAAAVRLREVAPADTSAVQWGEPTWSAGDTELTADADGWVDVDLTADETAAFTLVNTATAPIPNTGGTWSPVVTYVGVGAVLLGLVLVVRRRRQRV